MRLTFTFHDLTVGDCLTVLAYAQSWQQRQPTASDLLAVLTIADRYAATGVLALPFEHTDTVLKQFYTDLAAHLSQGTIDPAAAANVARLLDQVGLDDGA